MRLMARVFVLVEDETGRQTGRGLSFDGVMSYVLRDAGPSSWRGTCGLVLPIESAAAEMEHTVEARHKLARRSGPKTKRPVLHAVLGWHAADLAWLTREHIAEAVKAALRSMGLIEHQSVWVTHTDTGRPHVHLVANLVHPETGQVARLGLIKKRMSAHCTAYEQSIGDVRCGKRFEPRAANENRRRRPKPEQGTRKLKADFWSALRP